MASYPYTAFATYEATRPGAPYVFTFGNHKLFFASKKTGTWVVTPIATSGDTGQDYYGKVLIAHHGSEFLVWCSYAEEMFYSADTGSTWEQVTGHNVTIIQPTNIFWSAGRWAFVYDDGSIDTSTDRVHWTYTEGTLTMQTYLVWAMMQDGSGRLHQATDSDSAAWYGRSLDGGVTWTEQSLIDPTYSWGYPLAVGNNLAIFTTHDNPDGKVSLDGGATFGALTTVPFSGLAGMDSVYGGSYHSADTVAFKIVGGVLYVWVTAYWSNGDYWLPVYKSTDWQTGTPSWVYVGNTSATTLVGWDGMGWANSTDGTGGCLAFIGPRHLVGGVGHAAYDEIREVMEDLSEGALIYECTPHGSYMSNILPVIPGVGETVENFEEIYELCVKWWEVSGDEGGGYPGAPPFLYVDDVHYERPTGGGVYAGSVDFEAPTGDGIYVGRVRYE